MADGTGKKLYENGGRDLTPEGWEEMAAKLGEAATEAGKAAKALREHGRSSREFKDAKERSFIPFKEMLRIVGGGFGVFLN